MIKGKITSSQRITGKINSNKSIKGNINTKQKIKGSLNVRENKVYPELDNLRVTPSRERQEFDHPKFYGYDKVIVEAVEGEEIILTPTMIGHEVEGFFDKVIVQGHHAFLAENIREGEEIWGVMGTLKPGWDTSQIRSCYEMFKNNKEMTEPPYFDTSNVTNTSNMLNGCSNLIKGTKYNTSKVTTALNMYYNCSNLLEAPLIDTSNVTSFSGFHQGCAKLLIAPLYNTGKATSVANMYRGCISIIEIPEYDFSNVSEMMQFVFGCTNLLKIAELYAGKVIRLSNTFVGCNNLTTLGGFKDLGKAYTQKTANYTNYTLNLSACNKLTHESLINVINGLYDLNLTYNVANGGTLYMQKLQIGSTNLAKLTAEEIAIATNKGWNVS